MKKMQTQMKLSKAHLKCTTINEKLHLEVSL